MKGNGDFSIGHAVWPGTSKLLEEMGELQQILGKLIGSHGQPAHWDGSDLRKRLVEELGDLMAALTFFQEHNLTDAEVDAIQERMYKKWVLFNQWQAGHNQELVASPSVYDGPMDETDQPDPPPPHPKTHRHARTGQEHDYQQCWTPYGYCCSCELSDDTEGCTT